MVKKPEQPKTDPFVEKLEEKLSNALDTWTGSVEVSTKDGEKRTVFITDAKDQNALFANAIKFLMVKHKIGDKDGGEFFGGDD